MALALRSLHDLPSPNGVIDRRYPLGNAPVVTPSQLGINLAAFTAANFRLTSLPTGSAVDFNYRQFLTGTSAATAAITVNAVSGVLGNWVTDASGNGISNNTTVASSGSLIVTASNGTDPPVSFPVQQWSILSQTQQGSVKLPVGNGFWFDNQYWYNSTFGPGAEQNGFNSIISSMKIDPLLKFVYVSLTWGHLEGPTRGDYTRAFNAIDGILAVLATANHRMGLILEGWQEILNSAAINTTAYPQYVINNNWVVTGVQAGVARSQPKWDIDDLWSAANDMWVAICNRYNGHPLFFGISTMDESETANVADNGTHWCDSAHYNAKYLEQQLLLKSHLPNTLLYVPFNYLPPGDATEAPTMANMIRTLTNTYPTGILMGGPDPFKRQTTFQKLVSGLYQSTTGMGDIRNQILLMNRTQETYLGNRFVTVTNPDGSTKSVAQDPGVTPLQLYDIGVTNNCVVQAWNYENWLFYKYADQLNAIHTRGGVMGTPPNISAYTVI